MGLGRRRRQREVGGPVAALKERMEVCHIQRVVDIRGLKRGRCRHCIDTKERSKQHYSSFGCSACHAFLCKTRCYHRQQSDPPGKIKMLLNAEQVILAILLSIET